MKILKYDELNKKRNINENFTDKNTSITVLTNQEVSIYGKIIDEKHEDIYINKCTINWSFDIDITNGGINGIIPTIISIDLNTIVSVYDSIKDDTIENNMDINYNTENSNIIIDDKMTVGDFEKQVLPYSPKEVAIEKHLDNIDITITF